MKKYYYDLHIHSCLSPCGDDDNTPNNIAGMAYICGLSIVALTDHNTCKNCPAFFEAAKKYGIIPIAGMELTTSEDIHIVCLFERLDDAINFDNYINTQRIKIKNRPEIFGNQTILNENDEAIGEIEDLLINATNISISEVRELVEGYGGVCYPAHIDRESNGIITVLGCLPKDTRFNNYELYDYNKIDEFSQKYEIHKDRFIISSDAHYLTDIRDKECFFSFEEANAADITRQLFALLRRSQR